MDGTIRDLAGLRGTYRLKCKCNYVIGSPSIEPIVHGLSNHEINYIVIEDGEIVDQADFE